MGQYCCKSKKFKPKLEEPAKPPIEVDDFIYRCKFESGFKDYIEANFETKNLEKYLMVEQGGIFSLDLVIKVFMASFVWKNIIFDHMQKPLLQERINMLKKKEEIRYKIIINDLEDLEEKVFQSCFIRVKAELKIVEENFQRSMSLHMVTEENRKKIQKIEDTAFNYFMNVKNN